MVPGDQGGKRGPGYNREGTAGRGGGNRNIAKEGGEQRAVTQATKERGEHRESVGSKLP